MVRVTGFYRWKTGARFDHEYYSTTHMKFAREQLTPLGLLRLESDRFVKSNDPHEGDIIAASVAYFADLEHAQAAVVAAGQALLDSAARHTNLVPELVFSSVTVHL